MFLTAKAHFDLAMAWSGLALTAVSASAAMATAGARVISAQTALETSQNRFIGRTPARASGWPPTPAGLDPMQLVLAANEAAVAFWSGSLLRRYSGDDRFAAVRGPDPWSPERFWAEAFAFIAPRPAKAAQPELPLWWTAFADPDLLANRGPRPDIHAPVRSLYLH